MELLRNKNKATKIIFPLINLSSRPDYYSGTLTNVSVTAYSWADGENPASLSITDSPSELGSTGLWKLDLTQSEMNPDSGSDDYIVIKINADEIDEQTILIKLNAVNSNLKEIDGNAIGTNSSAVLEIKQLKVINDSGDSVVCQSTGGNGNGVIIEGDGSGHGIKVDSGNAGGSGIKVYSPLSHSVNFESGGVDKFGINILSSNGGGISIDAQGTSLDNSQGIKIDSEERGVEINSSLREGIRIETGSAGGHGIYIFTENVGMSPIKLYSTDAVGLEIEANGDHGIHSSTTSGNGILLEGDASSSDLKTKEIDSLLSGQTTIEGKEDTIIFQTDTLESGQSTIESKIDTVDGVVDTINTNTDSLEAGQSTIESKIDTSLTNETNIENKIDTVDGIVDTINDNTDSLETGQTTIESKVDTIDGIVDTINTNTDSLEAGQSTIESKIDTVDGVADDILIDTNQIQGKLPSGTISEFDPNSTDVDGKSYKYVLELVMAMVNGRFRKDYPVEGKITFYKRDNVTVLFTVDVTENERLRV